MESSQSSHPSVLGRAVPRRAVLAAAPGLALAAALAPAARRARADGGFPFVAADPPAPAPETPFMGADGAPVKLADFRGRLVLANFWATWCAPCVRELPSIARLRRAVPDPGFEALLVSIDRKGAAAYLPFLEKHGIEGLALAGDPRGALLRAFRLPGVPATVLVRPDGKVAGRLLGPAEWDTPEALALVRRLLPRDG